MGSDNFFSKLASVDPIAQAFDLPGAHKYAQSQAQDTQTNVGPYAGQTPTLAAANVGYAPGTTAQGAQAGWTPNLSEGGWHGLLGSLQKNANVLGNAPTTPASTMRGGGIGTGGLATSNPYVQNSQTVNPYVTAAHNAVGSNQRSGVGQQQWGA